MQNDEPLQWLRNKWTRRDDHSSDFLHYLINGQDVPNCIDGEPFLSNQGNNWITLEWPKPNYNEGAPILAYRVECCKYNDDEKDSHWTEVGISLHNSLDIFNLKSNESYMFRVTPRNRYGYGQSVTTFNPIKINETIEFPEFEKILPGHMIVLQFSPLKLQCQLRNPNESEVFWYKDSSKISEDDHITFNYHEGRCEMIINETNENDSGRYICEVVNNRGKACTYTTILIVTDPALVEAEKKLNRFSSEEIDKAPEFSMRLKDRTVQMTYPVRLSCQVVGYPEPVVMWFKDGHLIQGDSMLKFLS